MRDYQPKNKNPYYIDKSIYKSILYLIRSYNAQVKAYNDLIDERAFPKMDPKQSGKGNTLSDITGETALKLEGKSRIIKAIEKTIEQFKSNETTKYYFDGIWNNILYAAPYPSNADTRTYSRHKARFIWLVGKNLNII